MDPETVNQVCISANAQIVGAVGTFVMLMSGLVNTTWKVIREIWGAQKVLFFEINRLWKRP